MIMAVVFTDDTDGYDGSGSPTGASANIRVVFKVNRPNRSRLQLFARETSSTHAFQAIKTCYDSEVFDANVNGLDYYFIWKILSGSSVSASLAASAIA